MEANLPLMAKTFKSLADANRLKILYSLKEGRRSVSRIAEETQLSQPLVSHHLKILKESFLINTDRQGAFVYYQLPNKKIISYIDNIGNMLSGNINNSYLRTGEE